MASKNYTWDEVVSKVSEARVGHVSRDDYVGPVSLSHRETRVQRLQQRISKTQISEAASETL